jgi:hypothetical protein
MMAMNTTIRFTPGNTDSREETGILKRTVAGILAGGLLLAAGVAIAAESEFPASVNETASSAWHAGDWGPRNTRDVPRAVGSVFPSSVSEVGPSDVHGFDIQSPGVINTIRFTGSAIPMSTNETSTYR